MSRKLGNLVGVVLVCSLLLMGVGQVFAATAAPGTGPDTALAPAKGWVPLAVGQRIWYAFQYLGDNSQITIDMAFSPSNSVSFGVWTPQDLKNWAAGQGEHPVGRGSANSHVNGGDLVWTGSFFTPGTYYVVVDQTGPAPSNFLLNITGSGVSVAAPASQPAPAGQAAPAAQPAPATKAPAATAPVTQTTTTAAPAAAPATTAPAAAPAKAPAAPAAPSGMGPDTAKAPANGWVTIAMGQRVWYAFQYAGDASQITVDMLVSPASAVTFSVWTPADLVSWQQGNAENPVGRGNTVSNKFNLAHLNWSGNFKTPGTYYVVVDQTGPTAGGYSLSITGTGVATGMASK